MAQEDDSSALWILRLEQWDRLDDSLDTAELPQSSENSPDEYESSSPRTLRIVDGFLAHSNDCYPNEFTCMQVLPEIGTFCRNCRPTCAEGTRVEHFGSSVASFLNVKDSNKLLDNLRMLWKFPECESHQVDAIIEKWDVMKHIDKIVRHGCGTFSFFCQCGGTVTSGYNTPLKQAVTFQPHLKSESVVFKLVLQWEMYIAAILRENPSGFADREKDLCYEFVQKFKVKNAKECGDRLCEDLPGTPSNGPVRIRRLLNAALEFETARLREGNEGSQDPAKCFQELFMQMLAQELYSESDVLKKISRHLTSEKHRLHTGRRLVCAGSAKPNPRDKSEIDSMTFGSDDESDNVVNPELEVQGPVCKIRISVKVKDVLREASFQPGSGSAVYFVGTGQAVEIYVDPVGTDINALLNTRLEAVLETKNMKGVTTVCPNTVDLDSIPAVNPRSVINRNEDKVVVNSWVLKDKQGGECYRIILIA